MAPVIFSPSILGCLMQLMLKIVPTISGPYQPALVLARSSWSWSWRLSTGPTKRSSSWSRTSAPGLKTRPSELDTGDQHCGTRRDWYRSRLFKISGPIKIISWAFLSCPVAVVACCRRFLPPLLVLSFKIILLTSFVSKSSLYLWF